MKKILSYSLNVLGVILIAFSLLVVVQHSRVKLNPNYIPNIGGITYLNVLSESMTPEFKIGDLVIGAPVGNDTPLAIGDVITYKDRQGNLVTHRIVADTGNGYLTKGDANAHNDGDVVMRQSIVSKQVRSIPFLGHLVAKLQNQMFMICSLILLAILLLKEIYLEVKKMKQNVSKVGNSQLTQ